MYLGVDLGTSGIKVVLCDEEGNLVDSHNAPLSVSRPFPLWSEQDPNSWWDGFCQAMQALKERNKLQSVKSIGLSGQMHGATLLDDNADVIRPAILWNDGRCEAQCVKIESTETSAREVTGNLIMPGFTAPKLLWVKEHEPDLFARINKVLLPKDYLRFLMTGDYASDMSDAVGTMWLDTAKRTWHSGMLVASGLNESHMPTLYEGNEITGYLKKDLADEWGMSSVPIVAGGGDNAAGAVGVGIVKPGQGMLSLGTSGVYFVVGDGFSSNPESAVHSFCHALPNTWYLMSVLLSAASCLQWYAESIAKKEVGVLLDELNKADIDYENAPLFLPYLSGERTPHNNPSATGSFFGLTHNTDQATLTHSVLEGVSFAFADGVEVLHKSGLIADDISLIGGGARSPYWRQMLADILQLPVSYRQGGEVGPALGAARLAKLGVNNTLSIAEVCPVPDLVQQHVPNEQNTALYSKRRQTFQALYAQIKDLY
jgi:xylulokinase